MCIYLPALDYWFHCIAANFEAFKAVSLRIPLFWDMTLYQWVIWFLLLLLLLVDISALEDEDITLPQNVRTQTPSNTALYFTRMEFSLKCYLWSTPVATAWPVKFTLCCFGHIYSSRYLNCTYIIFHQVQLLDSMQLL